LQSIDLRRWSFAAIDFVNVSYLHVGNELSRICPWRGSLCGLSPTLMVSSHIRSTRRGRLADAGCQRSRQSGIRTTRLAPSAATDDHIELSEPSESSHPRLRFGPNITLPLTSMGFWALLGMTKGRVNPDNIVSTLKDASTFCKRQAKLFTRRHKVQASTLCRVNCLMLSVLAYISWVLPRQPSTRSQSWPLGASRTYKMMPAL
jgi:hypothetical protein